MADKQQKFGSIYQVGFEHIVQIANKISYDSLSNLKVPEMKEFCVKGPLYIIFCTMKVMSEFCKSVKWWEFITKNCVKLWATLHTIQSLLVHKNASHWQWSEDFMTSNGFHAFHRFADLQS